MPRLLLLLLFVCALPVAAQPTERFEPIDVFGLEYAADPQISPDGERIVYVRRFFDIMTDRARGNLWTIDFDGSDHRPLTSGSHSHGSPRWSPDGNRLAYVSSEEGSSQLYVRWMDTGQHTRLAQLPSSPSNLAWSPDGRWIAFMMAVKQSRPSFVTMPQAPEGAEWAAPARVVDRLDWRSDGEGLSDEAYTHLFVIPAEGGTPRRLTDGPYDHGGTPAWTADGSALIVSGNRRPDAESNARDTELYRVDLTDGIVTTLTDRRGPDGSPVVSPDGRHIAYLGSDERYLGYQLTRLYLADLDGGNPRALTADLDRSVSDPVWAADGDALYVQYDEEGNTKLARVDLDGDVEVLAGDVGGMTLGRPYGSGAFSVAANGRYAFTHTRPDHPADVAVGGPRTDPHRLTDLNDDLFGHKTLGEVEPIWYTSSFDGKRVQGWIVKPPDFDPNRRYPLILEIHGGPFQNYGDRFTAELQLFAAAGYVVLYTNPRGSTSYGEDFGNLIHHNYPGQDYDDLMSGVDAVIEQGYVDPDRLFVTGGSGGGVLTSWIVGKTDRFRAAVVAKPVINWISFALTSDGAPHYPKYWFPGSPWDEFEHYWERSPLSLVGNVSTPTMLLTGEADLRTPISESEQYYQALRSRGVQTMLVRIPGASHGIAARPSNLISKVLHILAWFERYDAAETNVGG